MKEGETTMVEQMSKESASKAREAFIEAENLKRESEAEGGAKLRCPGCGRTFQSEERYFARGGFDKPTFEFCSEACRDGWLTERGVEKKRVPPAPIGVEPRKLWLEARQIELIRAISARIVWLSEVYPAEGGAEVFVFPAREVSIIKEWAAEFAENEEIYKKLSY